jgi:2-polyprenyl-3-methyl-5-hydroxy-6-metoxy-1,4-benzoquinol methylase
MAPWMVVPGDFQRPDHPGTYALQWCRDCQFGQLHPRPDKNEIPEFYKNPSYYTKHDGRSSYDSGQDQSVSSWREGFTLLDRMRVKLAWLNDHSSMLDATWLRGHLIPRAKVCDLGCGNGDLLTRLVHLGCEVTGVEPDPDACQTARKQGHRVLPGTAEELPDEIRRERYDCVVMSDVLEHCLDPRLAVSNAASLLADRGTLIIQTPNNGARGLQRAGILWPWLDVPRHLNFFTSNSLQVIFAKAGISVQFVEHYSYTRQFYPNWIDGERNIHDLFAERVDCSIKLPSPHRGLNSWLLLFSTAWSSDGVKYDSVRVVGRRPEDNPAT